MTIESPAYSFIQLLPLDILNSNAILPFGATEDVRFQFILTVASEAIGDAIMATNIALRVVDGIATITDGTALAANTLHNYSAAPLYFSKYRLTTTTILFYWSHGLPDFASYLSVGQCFKLAVVITYDSDTVIGISNVLKRTSDLVYTTAITYGCNENSFGFTFCVTGDVPINTARVPFYLRKIPQFTDEESVYIKSDGSIKILKSVTKKEYPCVTDYLDASTHEKLKIAFSCDTVTVISDSYVGGIRKNGAYEIEPLDITGDIDIAQAKCKLLATPYNVRNNNCGNC